MPRFRSVCLAGGALVAVVAAGSAPEPWREAPAPAAPVAAAAPDPEGSQAIAPPGRILRVPAADGRIVDIAVLGVRLRRGNHKLVDVRLRYALRRGASYRMDPAREAQLVDGSDQLLTAMRVSDLRPALEPAVLLRGHPRAGWVTFRRPTAARVIRLQVTLDAGRGPHTGQWRVSPQP